jgi:hypothetical protein
MASAAPLVGRQVTCSFCGIDFSEDPAQPTCRSCPFRAGSGCGAARCTRCGYENPVTPPWLDRVFMRVHEAASTWKSGRPSEGVPGGDG